MLLSHLILALSASFVPVAQGRPAGTPPSTSGSHHPSAEPGTLLGRRYVVQDHHETAHVPRGYAAPAGYAHPAGYSPPEAPRHPKPFAQYLAQRDQRRADALDPSRAPNYVSHVGPAPPVQPVEPAQPFVAAVPPSPPAEPSAPPAPIAVVASVPAGSSSAASSMSTSLSSMSASTTMTNAAKKTGGVKSKPKSKSHSGGK